MRDENKEAKVDRRVIFTKASIKDALLEEIKNHSFEEIGIVGLCEKAQISRPKIDMTILFFSMKHTTLCLYFFPFIITGTAAVYYSTEKAVLSK